MKTKEAVSTHTHRKRYHKPLECDKIIRKSMHALDCNFFQKKAQKSVSDQKGRSVSHGHISGQEIWPSKPGDCQDS